LGLVGESEGRGTGEWAGGGVMAFRPSLMAPTMASASFESSPSGRKGLSLKREMILWDVTLTQGIAGLDCRIAQSRLQSSLLN